MLFEDTISHGGHRGRWERGDLNFPFPILLHSEVLVSLSKNDAQAQSAIFLFLKIGF